MSRIHLIAVVGTALSLVATRAFADLPQPDRGFATRAAQDQKSEIQDAEAGMRSNAPKPVRLLAQTIINDHTEALADLKAVGRQENFSLPDDVRPNQQQARTKLKNLPVNNPSEPQPNTRDTDYVSYEIGRLQDEIGLFNNELARGTNPGLKSYARKYMPTLEHELEEARSIKMPA